MLLLALLQDDHSRTACLLLNLHFNMNRGIYGDGQIREG